MKALLVTISIILFSQSVHAAQHQRSGKIALMRSHAVYWGSDSWIQLEGIGGNPGCIEGLEAGTGTGLTYMVIPSAEKNLYSFLLAAHMAGKTVEVNFSSDELSHGLCTVRFATLAK